LSATARSCGDLDHLRVVEDPKSHVLLDTSDDGQVATLEEEPVQLHQAKVGHGLQFGLEFLGALDVGTPDDPVERFQCCSGG
jgi:hypothetical protein